MTPQSGGPCFALPPFSMVWHCAHFALKSLAPFFTSPSGTSTLGSGIGIAKKEKESSLDAPLWAMRLGK